VVLDTQGGYWLGTQVWVEGEGGGVSASATVALSQRARAARERVPGPSGVIEGGGCA
jgi:hypothetical protein